MIEFDYDVIAGWTSGTKVNYEDIPYRLPNIIHVQSRVAQGNLTPTLPQIRA